MKKIRSRGLFTILLALVVVAGLCLFIRDEYVSGRKWAMFFSGFDASAEGELLDRSGKMLASFNRNGKGYSPDVNTRIANYHVTGDYAGMTGCGALTRFWNSTESYDYINGTKGGRRGSMRISVDADVNSFAWKLLVKNGQEGETGRGTVMIMNYRTGEVLALVSSPSVDPSNSAYVIEDGAYFNRALRGTYTPGSTFKLITAAAAIENLPALEEMTFSCGGEYDIAGVKITCDGVHGTQTFAEALANSCNCAFAQVTVKLGQNTMVKYVQDLGFLSPHSLDGMEGATGNYPLEFVGDPELAWSGIGQSIDQVCPYTMLRYVAAIANDGVLIEPTYLLQGENALPSAASPAAGTPKSTAMLCPDTAKKLQELMRNNVATHYEGDTRFPGLALCAKTGTAETGNDTSHSWFTGFLQDEAHPYAFVAVVEEGGYGLWTAGLMMNEILQYMVKK